MEGIDTQDHDASDGETLAGSPTLVSRLSLNSPTRATTPPMFAMTRSDDAMTSLAGSQLDLVHRGWHWQQMNTPNAMDALESGERHELEDVHGWSHEPELEYHARSGGHDRGTHSIVCHHHHLRI